jgi:uncharacterized protein (TIGR00369 family)
MTDITFESLRQAGWTDLTTEGFTGYVGPFWFRGDAENHEVGMLVEDRHTNSHIGTLHGGVVMTFADIGLGSAMSKVLGEKARGFVTLSLQTQFVSVARVGEFISCKPEIVRQARDVVFIRGLIKVGDKTIASAEGLWKQMASAK